MKAALETERLYLRPWEMEDDKDLFFGWANDAVVTKYLTWNPHGAIAATRFVIQQWISEYEDPKRLNFAIVLKTENKLIGGIDIVGYPEGIPEIGYVLNKSYWGNGYMTEACKALLEYLRYLGYRQAKIAAMVDNIGSNRVIEKCGGVLQKTEWVFRKLKNDEVLMNVYLVSLE